MPIGIGVIQELGGIESNLRRNQTRLRTGHGVVDWEAKIHVRQRFIRINISQTHVMEKTNVTPMHAVLYVQSAPGQLLVKNLGWQKRYIRIPRLIAKNVKLLQQTNLLATMSYSNADTSRKITENRAKKENLLEQKRAAKKMTAAGTIFLKRLANASLKHPRTTIKEPYVIAKIEDAPMSCKHSRHFTLTKCERIKSKTKEKEFMLYLKYK